MLASTFPSRPCKDAKLQESSLNRLRFVVFQHGDQGASNGKTRTIQGMDKFHFALRVFKAGLQAAGRERFAVGHRADLAVGVL